MPTFEVVVPPQRRSFLLRFPKDWADFAWGTLDLVIGLHGDGQTAEEFYLDAQIDDLMAGLLPTSPGAAVPTKFFSVFPQALSLSDPTRGSWNTGFSGGEGGLIGVDDVSAIVACVEEAGRVLAGEWARLRDQPVPVGEFFAKVLILGFGEGGTMAYRCATELPSRDTTWGVGVLAPNSIAVAECTSGGLPSATLAGGSAFPAISLVRWDPAAGTSCNVLHMQSDQDDRSSIIGGVSTFDRDRVDDALGTVAGTATFYPWHLQMGASFPTPAPLTFDPTFVFPGLPQKGLGPWVSALPGGPVATAVSSQSAPGGQPVRWTWDSNLLVVVGGTIANPVWAPHSVHYLLWSSISTEREGHYWPQEARDGFSGTALAWRFFEDHP